MELFLTVATDNTLSDTPGNFFNTDESGVQINSKPDSLIREKGLKMFGKIEKKKAIKKVLMLPPNLIFRYVNSKQEFGDDLLPWSDAYMNGKSSFISTDLFIKVVHRALPQTKTFREAYYTFRLPQNSL